MKQLIGHDIGSYTFNPTSKTITFSGIPAISLEQILTVTNTTDGVMIYCFADPSLFGILAGNTLTLNYDTTSMSSADSLQIYIDLPSTIAIDQAAMQEAYTHILLSRIADLLEPVGMRDAACRQRVVIDSIASALTLSTVTTVSTLTTVTNPVPVGNVATMGGQDPKWMMVNMAKTAYATAIRNNITFGN